MNNFLEMLPPEYRERVILRSEKDIIPTRYLKNYIMMNILWAETKEGEVFWNKIYNWSLGEPLPDLPP